MIVPLLILATRGVCQLLGFNRADQWMENLMMRVIHPHDEQNERVFIVMGGVGHGLEIIDGEAQIEQPINDAEEIIVVEHVETHLPPELFHNYQQEDNERNSDDKLNAGELSGIEDLLNQFKELKTPISPKTKNLLNTLKVKTGYYKDLSQKLEEVHTALMNKDHEAINDELIRFTTVETPIWFFKQYQKKGQWHTIYHKGYVTDKNALTSWLEANGSHPLYAELVEKPRMHNPSPKSPNTHAMSPTRYRWNALTVDNCSVQELGEIASQLRKLTAKLSSRLESVQSINPGAGSSAQSIFGTKGAAGISFAAEEGLDEFSAPAI